MVQLRTKRAAFGLYGVLVVLPTVILGWLQGAQILEEKRAELEALPRDTQGAALRFRDAVSSEVEKLIESEYARPFEHYARFYYPPAVGDGPPALTPSPLVSILPPLGIQAWFVFDMREGDASQVELFFGADAQERQLERPQIEAAAELFKKNNASDSWIMRASRLDAPISRLLSLRSIATSRATEEDRECLDAIPEILDGTKIDVTTSEFHLQIFQYPPGVPRVVATRRMLMPNQTYLQGWHPCLDRLKKGMGLVQGFFIDPGWLFSSLPSAAARNVLDDTQRFRQADVADAPEGTVSSEVRLLEHLDVEPYSTSDLIFGRYQISVDTREVEARFQQRAWRFLGVAGMLTVSLMTGLALLLRSARSDLEQAHRMENFVHAVTHELRTPLSAIQLHGEMLLDGWATDENKRKEYYRRIVRETARLSTLVERVLQKARLSSGAAKPFSGSLAEELQRAFAPVVDNSEFEGRDVRLVIEDDLPPVQLTSEAVQSIVTNLVENARKYAPVDPAKPGWEPIVVSAKRTEGGVLLEVLDRGPGIPPGEAKRIFDAFYRIGNERTRTARGTGLGLHLVQLSADSVGGSVSVSPRPGGGSVFRVKFRTS